MRRKPFWLNSARNFHALCAVLAQFCTPFPFTMRRFGPILHPISTRRAPFWLKSARHFMRHAPFRLNFPCHFHAPCVSFAQRRAPSIKLNASFQPRIAYHFLIRDHMQINLKQLRKPPFF
ncbi:hypothetical protein HanIR_Chr09g0397661 [Helianthus annuus]|nr:hypothetical protein HanIR_Chr09g0397661 [Helianthus annuus]